MSADDIGVLLDRLLAWYDAHRRELPWRAAPGERADPYHVLLSEIMLQQTTAATAAGRFGPFLDRFPTLQALAAAHQDEVLHAWQGLGYYRRARALHACAQAIVERHGGRVPQDATALAALPGIGPYTTAAVRAIAFERPEVPVDGNVQRVLARLFALEAPLPGAAGRLRKLAASLAPDERAGDVAQALMDLGASVCRPRRPACGACPWQDDCRAHRLDRAEELPRRAPRPVRPVRRGLAFSWPGVTAPSCSASGRSTVCWAACTSCHRAPGGPARSSSTRRSITPRRRSTGACAARRCATSSPTSCSSFAWPRPPRRRRRMVCGADPTACTSWRCRPSRGSCSGSRARTARDPDAGARRRSASREGCVFTAEG